MRSFLGYLVQGESGFASAWSIPHFLSGLVPHAIWAYFIPADAWISLFVLATLAALFELVENTPGAGKVMWTWIGYTTENYRIDTLRNAVSDILFLLAGWLVAQVVHLLAPDRVAFWALLGAAGVLVLLFLWLFSLERQKWLRDKEGTNTARPVTIPPVAEPAPLPPPTAAGLRFVLPDADARAHAHTCQISRGACLQW